MTRLLMLLSIVTLVVGSAFADEVAELRAGSQSAVDALYAQYLRAEPEQRADLEARLDRVCAQKDCAASRLFWYTDLDEAKVAAQKLHRPILALHLLGRLDEELSCANSRLFRTLLYSDDAISATLRDQYVLYWHSVRPVPRVTIEMGDGRVIHQTITGNSAHYVLDENGDVLDVLPGLYSPAAFRAELTRWVALHNSLAGESGTRRREIVRRYHAALLGPGERLEPASASWNRRSTPTAIEASKLVVSKSAIELPMLTQLQKRTSVPIADLLPMSDWIAVGEQRKDEVQFSAAAIALIQKKQFGTAPIDEDSMNDLLDNIRRNVAADTAFNEATLRPRVHRWFANGLVVDLVSLNERVYRELFLTPSDDPWLGLQPASVFTAIGGGS